MSERPLALGRIFNPYTPIDTQCHFYIIARHPVKRLPQPGLHRLTLATDQQLFDAYDTPGKTLVNDAEGARLRLPRHLLYRFEGMPRPTFALFTIPSFSPSPNGVDGDFCISVNVLAQFLGVDSYVGRTRRWLFQKYDVYQARAAQPTSSALALLDLLVKEDIG